MTPQLEMYLLIAIFGLVISIFSLPTLISRDINKKNERKIRRLEALLKEKQKAV